jgi:hypothetical protein
VPLAILPGTHYLRDVSVGGKAQLIIKTSAQSLTEAKESSTNLAATVSGSYGLFSGKVSAQNDQSEKSKVYNALKDSKKLVSQSPVYTGTRCPPPVAVSPRLSLSFHTLVFSPAYFVRWEC